MVGLKIRPVAKLNHNHTEVLPADGKEGWRGGWKQEAANAGMYTVVPTFNKAMKLIASWKRGLVDTNWMTNYAERQQRHITLYRHK